MPQRTYDISVFRGAVGSADPQDIDVGEASFAQNVSFVDKIGSLQGLTKDELLVTSNLKTDNGNIISPLAHTEGGSSGVHTIVGIQTRGFSNASPSASNRVIGLSVYKEDAEQLFRSSKIYQGADRVESDVVHAYAEMNDGIYFGSSAYTPKVVEIIDHNQFGATPVNDKAFPGGVVALDIVDGGSGYTEAPDVTITDNGGTGTGARAVATIDGAGTVDSITVTVVGSRYTGPLSVSISAPPPGGTPAAVAPRFQFCTKAAPRTIPTATVVASRSPSPALMIWRNGHPPASTATKPTRPMPTELHTHSKWDPGCA